MFCHGVAVFVPVGEGIKLGSMVNEGVPCTAVVTVLVAVGDGETTMVLVAARLGVEVSVDVGNHTGTAVAVAKVVGSGVRVRRISGG